MAEVHPSMQRLPTHDDVWRILQDAIGFRYPDGQKPTRPFWTRDATEGFTDILDTFYKDLSPDKRLENAKNLCREWCILIADPNGHWELLNQAFAERLHIHFDSIKEPPGHYVRQATELLARLSTAKFTHYNPDDETSCAELDPRYFTSQEAPRVIQNLNLVSLVDTNTIRVVLWFLVTEGLTAGSLERYLFFLTEQLEAALHLSVGNGVGPTQLLLIRAFLWKSWQRATILFRWYILDRKLNVGGRLAGDTFAAAISRHHKRLAASVGHPLVVAVPQSSEIPPYMCQWAFELLRTNRATSATDFSHFLHRYNQAFGSLPARCVPIPTTADSFQQCPGQSPAQCRRFTGAVIKDQSVHAAFCGGSCQRLYWDKECYVSVREGARAVALDMAEDGLLKYCSASETTMAISHVWSHGQGGRPENVESSTGFNSCLHQKYSAIARRFGCQSYWMDTPCIPEDHDLQKEAIKNINQVFEASQFTLVCDRDIMTIDVRKRHDDMIGTYESLLAALLVCDWNARAWTLLEGYQGRENIHLLCKDDEIIRLADIIDVVHRAGDIVLGNMCLAMDHLIPLRGPRIKDPQDKRFSVEQSGRLLSHRHASRTGDEIVIWSLLRGGLFNTAEDFWRNHSTVIQTGFLISDAPRISDVPGMGWAPARPDLPPATDVVSTRHFAFEGHDTEVGFIRPDGRLQASWYICMFADASFLWGAWGYCSTQVVKRTGFMAGDVLFLNAWNQQCDEQAAYHRGMAMLNVATKRKAEEIAANVGVDFNELGFLQAAEVRGRVPYTYLGDVEGTLLVVVKRNGNDDWTWIKVILWESDILLPPFIKKKISIR